MNNFIKNFLKNNFFKKIEYIEDLDSANTNKILKDIINRNIILNFFYLDCYNIFKKELEVNKENNSVILEIGSGAGFIKKIIPNTITSEIITLDGIDLQMDATNLKFKNNSLDSILLLNVLHHIADPKQFIFECQRVLKKKGTILMIEPANTWFSRIIYKNFHHEDFNEYSNWHLRKGGRLSESNQAMPHIIFERDIEKFRKFFPQLLVTKKYKFKPIHYLLSGGFTYKPLFNNKFFILFIKLVEFFLSPFNKVLGLFMFIKVVKDNS